MDYEKAYKAVLQTATQWIKDGCTDKEKICLECVFPELAGSEDEKMMSRIIDGFKNFSRSASKWNNIPIEEVIAYLEKQKEQKPVPKFSVGDYVIDTNYKGEPLYQIVGIDKECYICEYRGDKGMGDRTVMHFAFNNPYLRLEQKPEDRFEEAREKYQVEWSEEDEKMLTGIIERGSSQIPFGEPALRGEQMEWLMNMLKSHRPQPKREWSEEDENIVKMILRDLEWERRNTTVDKDIRHYDKEIVWLKSLRPSWKPSEDEERLINTSISFLKDFADKGYENAVECIDWLKSKLNGNSGK